MEQKINVGIIGCGHLGKMHLKNLKDIEKENQRISIAGIYDINLEKAGLIADEFKVKYYDKFENLLNDINAAIIVAPTSAHFSIAEITLGLGIHSFIEKPVTDHISDAYKLKELIRNKNITVQVGHIERFNPALLAVDYMQIEPLFIESHRLSQFNPRGSDVSVIQDLMIHDIDIILNLVKSKVKKIDASGVAIITDKIDIANARLKFENGCIANITASRISNKKMRKMRIFQKNAYVSVDFFENSAEVFKLTEDLPDSFVLGTINKEGKTFNISYEKPSVQSGLNAMKYELNMFFDSILQGKEPKVTLEESIQALEVATEIINEIEKNPTSI